MTKVTKATHTIQTDAVEMRGTEAQSLEVEQQQRQRRASNNDMRPNIRTKNTTGKVMVAMTTMMKLMLMMKMLTRMR